MGTVISVIVGSGHPHHNQLLVALLAEDFTEVFLAGLIRVAVLDDAFRADFLAEAFHVAFLAALFTGPELLTFSVIA